PTQAWACSMGPRNASFLDQDQGIGAGPLLALAGAVPHGSQGPESGRAASVKIQGLFTPQLDEVISQFRESHAERQVALPAVYLDHEDEILVPTQGRARMPDMQKTGPLHGFA